MDRQQISVKLAMDGLGLKFCIGSFRDRLILQKTIYLVQTAGVKLGYYYSWYIHGPYCSPLTSDGFAIDMEIAQGFDEWKEWQLDAGSIDRLRGIKELFSEGDRQELARKLELLASVHFLIVRNQVPGGDVKSITETLKRFGKNFTKSDVQHALEELKRYGLLS